MTTQYQITVPVAGANGAAAGSATSTFPIYGILVAVHLDHTTGAATADVTITVGSPSQTVLTVTDSTTDAWYYPQVQIHTTAGAAISAQYMPPQVCGYVTVTVAQSNAGSVVASLLVVEG